MTTWHDAVESVKDTVQDTVHDLKHSARQAGRQLEDRGLAQAAGTLIREQAATTALLTRQQKELQQLRREVAALGKQRGGGFPWGLVLLAGGAYALYRYSPSVRDQVQGLLNRLDPGIQGNLTRAGDAVKDAVSSAVQGESPKADLQSAGGELKRAGEKAVDGAKDKAQDLKNDAQKGAQDLQRDAQDRRNLS